MRLLDLFCGAGGAAMGYHRAGFDVVGVDIAPQPHYPFEFIQVDAMTFPLDGFNAIHASPPCKFATRLRGIHNKSHLDLLTPMRARLRQIARVPWVIENVPGAPMRSYIELCGTMFGLKVYRHRWFESSELLLSPGQCSHPFSLLPGYVCVAGNKAKGHQRGNIGNRFDRIEPAEAKQAMGCDWMTLAECSQAVPPAYTEWVGRQLVLTLAA